MKNKYALLDYIRGAVYFTIYGLVKYLPSPIFDPLRWLVLKVFMNKISTMWIKDGVTVWFPHGVSIGHRVSINEWVFIDGFGGVDIGDDCRIAHGCSFIRENHKFEQCDISIRLQGKTSAKIVVGRDCWLGCGVRIGDGCIIGAGSVVTRDIPPYSVAVGVPAKVVRSRGTGKYTV